jgi:hypothetical protein
VGLALVTRIPNLAEAHIAAGALRSGGIAAEVFDGNFGQLESPVIEALGGFRIMAPEGEVAAAKEILAMLRAGPGLGEPEDNAPWGAERAQASRARTKGVRVVATILLAGSAAVALIRFLWR